MEWRIIWEFRQKFEKYLFEKPSEEEEESEKQEALNKLVEEAERMRIKEQFLKPAFIDDKQE